MRGASDIGGGIGNALREDLLILANLLKGFVYVLCWCAALIVVGWLFKGLSFPFINSEIDTRNLTELDADFMRASKLLGYFSVTFLFSQLAYIFHIFVKSRVAFAGCLTMLVFSILAGGITYLRLDTNSGMYIYCGVCTGLLIYIALVIPYNVMRLFHEDKGRALT